MLTRRDVLSIPLAGLVIRSAATETAPQQVGGVAIGAQTYSFRDLPRGPSGDAVDVVVNALKASGLTECELFAPQLQPQLDRERTRAWRLATPLDHFRAVRKTFDAAGVRIYAYNYSFNATFTDAEIDRGFDMAKALGADIITASTTLDVARRIKPFAEKHQMVVAMHNHSNVKDPNEFATPESFAAATAMSKLFKINLDIGHFTAANFDAIGFLREHHASVTNLHLKDRRRNQGDNVPWGQGDTPIREVLQLLKKEKWPIRAYIEYEYPGQSSPIEEVKKCYAFAKEALS